MRRSSHGFTLIELSIVLVIIGLIVGGILVGQEMIASATARSTISQLEKYNTAVNTFRGKYGGLPGDLQFSLASQFGFNTTNCNGTQGNRDGNGLIDGYASPLQYSQTQGETGLFWQDLSASLLIPDQIPNGGAPAIVCNQVQVTTTTPGSAFVGDLFPLAKLGGNAYFVVYEANGVNWFCIVGSGGTDTSGSINHQPIMTVMQAYRMDSKIDDGLPQTGNVQANSVWNAGQYGNVGQNNVDNATSCYHTHGAANLTSWGYSITINNGAGVNCALSFKFQGGE